MKTLLLCILLTATFFNSFYSSEILAQGSKIKGSFSNKISNQKKLQTSKLKGWDYLAHKLQASGVDNNTIYEIFSHKKMPKFSFIPFAVAPRESAALYTSFSRPDKIKMARDFLKTYDRYFAKAEKLFGVPRNVIASILLIETQFGRVTGKHLALIRLTRLAGLSDPNNIKRNYLELRKTDPEVTLEAVQARAKYLEDLFLPEVVSLIRLSKKQRINPFNVKGSIAGAFGIPQFLPSSYEKYAVDCDNNQIISLFSKPDAICSTGNFLKAHGWKPGMTKEQTRQVIWYYNRSDAYVSAVLQIASLLEK